MPNSALSKIAAALGLDGTADEAAILTAINREKVPDPARFVPIEAVRELVAERAQVRALASEQTAVARVEQATNAGYLTPAMRDWAVALCRDDPASFDIGLFKRKSVSAHWEFMFTRSMFATADLAEQGRLLDEVAQLVDAGQLKTTLNTRLGPIDAATLKRAHALVETGRSIGKVVVEGWESIRSK